MSGARAITNWLAAQFRMTWRRNLPPALEVVKQDNRVVSRAGSRQPSWSHNTNGRREPTLLQLANQDAAELDRIV